MTDGRPVPVKVDLSEPIRCNWKANKWDKKGKVIDGVFTQAQYEILVEPQDFEFETLTLYDTTLCKRLLGVFAVQSVEHFPAVGATKITV